MCSFSFNLLRSNFFTFITRISEILNIESLLEFFKFHNQVHAVPINRGQDQVHYVPLNGDRIKYMLFQSTGDRIRYRVSY